MKILHLSDLHIGKIIYEQSLLEDQEYMLKQIEKIIEKEKIEAVLISGDIYDRSIPRPVLSYIHKASCPLYF